MSIICCIDVGIKNLSCCISNIDTKKIIKWELIDLSGKQPIIKQKCFKCKITAKYSFRDTVSCGRHCPKVIITDDLSNIENNTIPKIKELINKYSLIIPKNKNKDCLLKVLKDFIYDNFSTPIVVDKQINCKDITIVDIARRLNIKMTDFIGNIQIDKVIIENQIMTRMIEIQAMITLFFVIYRPITIIQLINASMKLSTIVTDGVPVIGSSEEYKDRKKWSVQLAYEYLKLYNNQEFIDMFDKSKKKDDLSDSLLFCIYFINLFHR